MDLWAWVNATEKRLAETGHERLSTLIDRIPHEVCNDRHDRSDALVPEALALAKGLGEPWIELFLRHWDLQSKVLHRMDGRSLGDAVSLVELAHRDETRACPQAVCAVQDLAAAYGIVDGPGYAEERKEVSRETLERIDTSWSCFTCISTEYASALVDQRDYAGALAYVEQQIGKLAAAGEKDLVHDMGRARINALVGLERWQEALDLVADDEKNGRHDEHHDLWRRLDRAMLYQRVGRSAEAKASLPPASAVMPTPFFYEAWTTACAALVRAGELPNDAGLGATLQRFVARLELQGVGRTTLSIAQVHGELALERGAVHVARRALAAMERSATLLHRPLGALERIQQLRAQIAAAPGLEYVTLPDDPAGVGALVEGLEPERALFVLEAAHARYPDDAAVTHQLASLLARSGHEPEAVDLLEALHARTGADETLFLLGNHLLRAEHAERLLAVTTTHRRLATDLDSRTNADWLLARAAYAQGRWKDCLEHLEVSLTGAPNSVNVRLMAAEVSRRLGDHTTAIAKLDEVVALGAPPGPADWDRMTSAAVLGDWARVRQSAARLGYELEGEGPIDERMGVCRIQLDDEDGRVTWAHRISPVTARIVSINAPPRVLRYHDIVAFDATPQNPPPQTDEERAEHTWIYPHVATLSTGGYRAHLVDGVHPGAARITALVEAMRQVGAELRELSAEEYEVGGERGFYGVLAVPERVTDAEACAALREACGDARLTFAELARDAGDLELATQHEALAEALEL